MRNSRRKIKNRKKITKEINIIRRRLIISLLLIMALILISIIIKNLVVGSEDTNPPADVPTDNIHWAKSSDGVWVPVPNGYSASKISGETSVNGGFVIYEGENVFGEDTVELTSVDSPAPETIAPESVIQEDSITNVEDEKQENSNLKGNEEPNITENVDNLEDNTEGNTNLNENEASSTTSKVDSIDDKKSEESNVKENEDSSTTEKIDTVENKKEDKINTDTKIEEDKEKILVNAEKQLYLANESLEELPQNDTNEKNIEISPEQNENEEQKDLENKDVINDDLDNNDSLEKQKTIVTDSQQTNKEEIRSDDVTLNDALEVPSVIDEDMSEKQESTAIININNKQEIFNLQCSTNQYVWVPVSKSKLQNLYGIDEDGKLWGKIRSFTSNATNSNNWEIIDGKMKILKKTGFREPDIVIEQDYESSLDYLLDKTLQYEFLQKELEQFFYTTLESIEKYGGFYIGRYETGGLNKSVAVVRKMDNDISRYYIMV